MPQFGNRYPRSKCYDVRDATVKPNFEHRSIVSRNDPLVSKNKGKRAKLKIPPEFWHLVDNQKRHKDITSDRQLAKLAGLSPPTITRGRKGLASWESICAIARVLQLPLPELGYETREIRMLRAVARENPKLYGAVVAMMEQQAGKPTG